MERIGLPGILIVEPDPDWIMEYHRYFWLKTNTVFRHYISDALAYLDKNEPRIEIIILDYASFDRDLLPELAEVFVGPIIATTPTMDSILENRCEEIEGVLDYVCYKMKAAKTAEQFLKSIRKIIDFYPPEKLEKKLTRLRANGHGKISAIFALEKEIETDIASLPFECKEVDGRIHTIISSKINLG